MHSTDDVTLCTQWRTVKTVHACDVADRSFGKSRLTGDATYAHGLAKRGVGRGREGGAGRRGSSTFENRFSGGIIYIYIYNVILYTRRVKVGFGEAISSIVCAIDFLKNTSTKPRNIILLL